MKNRRQINEDDIYLTEMLLARSYGNLKQSVADATSDTLGSLGESVGGTIRKHPYATAGAAVGIGILLFGLFRLMNRGGSSGGRNAGGRNRSPRSDMAMEIISLIMPMVTPHITAYLEKYLGKMISRDRGNA